MNNIPLAHDLALKRTVHAPLEQKPIYAWRDVLAVGEIALPPIVLLCPVSYTHLIADGADLPSLRIGGVDYVSLEDGASRLGLRLERLVPETTVMLKSGAQPVARLSDHSREIDLKGLRVFLGDPVAIHGGAFYVSRTDFEHRLLPRLRPDLCGPPPRPPHVIAIDPGHGGVDHGAENKALGSMEKTYTLDVSLTLKTVSYTHLDVYKRQVHGWPVSKIMESIFFQRSRASILCP